MTTRTLPTNTMSGKPVRAAATPYKPPRVIKPSTAKAPPIKGSTGREQRGRPVTTF